MKGWRQSYATHKHTHTQQRERERDRERDDDDAETVALMDSRGGFPALHNPLGRASSRSEPAATEIPSLWRSLPCPRSRDGSVRVCVCICFYLQQPLVIPPSPPFRKGNEHTDTPTDTVWMERLGVGFLFVSSAFAFPFSTPSARSRPDTCTILGNGLGLLVFVVAIGKNNGTWFTQSGFRRGKTRGGSDQRS